MRKTKTEKGITLIALIITIVLLLILAVSAITAIRNEDILGQAQNAAKTYNQAVANEQDMLGRYENYLEDRTGPISKERSYIGYYADFEGDGEIEGIIYADLAISYSAVTDKTTLKDYYISQGSYKPKNAEGEELAFEAKPVLTPIAGEKSERFYVMALSDVTSTETNKDAFCWYDAAYDNRIPNYSSVTSTSFGAGKENTRVMLEAWNAEPPTYGARNDNEDGYEDLWGYVKERLVCTIC